MNIQVAALIAVHDRVDCFQRLIHAIPSWKTYVHVDKKYDDELFLLSAPNAYFTPERKEVMWGRFDLVLVYLDLLKLALNDTSNTHFYAMTGRDFPLKPLADIEKKISSAKNGGQYMSICSMPQSHKPLTRITHRHYYNHTGKISYLWRKLDKRLPRYRVSKLLQGLKPHAGDAMWLISRDVAENLMQFLEENPWYIKAFSFSHAADEMFFQTLLVHLGVELDGGCPTATDWTGMTKHPNLVTEEIYNRFCKTEKFLGRKFDLFYP